MTDPDRDRALMTALSHLSKATQALQDANAEELRNRAFVLANDVLRFRKSLKQPSSVGA